MSGICGFWNLDGAPASAGLLEQMAASIAHRGPDGAGAHTDGPVALAHRRLALSAACAAQPLSNEDAAVWVTFDGKLYNSSELRRNLLAAGHALRTTDDAEILVHLWEQAGKDMAKQLVGMFAFAIWDSRQRCLFLARDRVGIRPLHCARYGNRFAFASELKAFCQDPAFPRQMKPEALAAYFCLTYIPWPDTIFEHARKVPPAHTMLLREANPSPETDCYWSVTFREGARKPPQDWLAEYEAMLDNIVGEHSRSDTPVGAFLSGGIDSSLVVSSLSRSSASPVNTFALGFEEAEYSELQYSDAVAEHCRTGHVRVIARPDVAQTIARLGRQYDEPFGDSSCLPTYLISRAAAEKVRVVLSGDGGDETMSGYTHYSHAVNRQRRQRVVPAFLRKRLFAPLCRLYPRHAPGAGLLDKLGVPPWRRFADYIQLMGWQEAAVLLRPACRLKKTSPADLFPALFPALAQGQRPLLDRMQEFDLTISISGDTLTKVDRASTLASLEVRMPFLDHRFIEFGATLPQSLRATHQSAKILSRELAYRRLPRKIIDRPKMGFVIPIVPWFRGPLKDFLQDHLFGPDSACRQFLDIGAVQQYFRSCQAGDAGADKTTVGRRLWSCLMFELWCRSWLNPSPPPRPPE